MTYDRGQRLVKTVFVTVIALIIAVNSSAALQSDGSTDIVERIALQLDNSSFYSPAEKNAVLKESVRLLRSFTDRRLPLELAVQVIQNGIDYRWSAREINQIGDQIIRASRQGNDPYKVTVALIISRAQGTSGPLTTRENKPAVQVVPKTAPPSSLKRTGTVTTQQPVSDNLYRSIRKYVGSPYRWGGTSAHGIDCSGFVMQVYRKLGVNLPRTSRQQSRVGQKIMPAQLKEGDLLFFSVSGKRIDHVGIFLSNGYLAHSRKGKGVEVVNLREYKYANKMVLAKRII